MQHMSWSKSARAADLGAQRRLLCIYEYVSKLAQSMYVGAKCMLNFKLSWVWTIQTIKRQSMWGLQLLCLP